jgi:hypothetical protein
MSKLIDNSNDGNEEQHPMTPHQKAINAAWNVLVERGLGLTRDEMKMAIAAYLASARESGSDMMPREPTEKMWLDSNEPHIWCAMFDAAPRFEDAA